MQLFTPTDMTKIFIRVFMGFFKKMKIKSVNKNISPMKRLLSFKYATKGILYMIKTQHNAQIHLMAALMVVSCGFYFSISKIEWLVLILTIGIVLATEAFNTAVEMWVDKISPENNKIAGAVKDIAAGAVLIMAVAAAIIGIIIFAPRVF